MYESFDPLVVAHNQVLAQQILHKVRDYFRRSKHVFDQTVDRFRRRNSIETATIYTHYPHIMKTVTGV